MDLISILTEVDFDLKIREVIDLWVTGQWRLERKRPKECVTYRSFKIRKRYNNLNYSIKVLKSFLIDNFYHSLSIEDNKVIFKQAINYLKLIYDKNTITKSITDDILLELLKLYCYSVSSILKNVISCLNDNDCEYLYSELVMGENEAINKKTDISFEQDIKRHYLNENYIFELGIDLINNLDLRCNKLKFADLVDVDENDDEEQDGKKIIFDDYY